MDSLFGYVDMQLFFLYQHMSGAVVYCMFYMCYSACSTRCTGAEVRFPILVLLLLQSAYVRDKSLSFQAVRLIRSKPISDFCDIWLTGGSQHPQDRTSVCRWKLPQ